MDRPETIADLEAIMDRLRGPQGCPWDREQTYGSLRGFLLEECYEVVDALDLEDPDALMEELGDLLFQIVFLSRLAKEERRFTLGDVIRGIGEKMVRRHPHVFGNARADTAEQALRHWEQIKREEKRQSSSSAPESRGSVLSGIPRRLPALMKAQRLGHKAARVGFEWDRREDILEKLEEELTELRRSMATGDQGSSARELGDVLFTLVMVACRLDVDPEVALEQTNRKFQERFQKVEREVKRRGMSMEDAGLELMDQIWDEVKKNEKPKAD